MLLLIDLDDTLIDRSGAFARWVHKFASEQGAPSSAADWIIKRDQNGMCARPLLAQFIKDEFRLELSVSEVLDSVMVGHLTEVALYPGVEDLLREFRARGWHIVVVTNGVTERQLIKYNHVGLSELVDGVVVSQSSGAAKPAAKIFDDALSLVPHSDVVWMVGDNPVADIKGGSEMGFKTGWVSHTDRWVKSDYAPTVEAPDTALVLQAILEAS